MFERMMTNVDPRVAETLDSALTGKEISVEAAELLLAAEGADLHALLWAADQARRDDNGDDVSYVVCRNVNSTNICYVGCSFCGFARHKHQADAYDHDISVVLEKCGDAVARGASEICIQGGIHPQKDHTHYHEVITSIKQAYPDLHLHAYSPEEIDWGHKKSGMELADYLRWMMDAAVAHSSAQGWPPERYHQIGSGFVVRSHRIRYLQPASAGDQVVVLTWVANFQKIRSLRKYKIVRPSDETRLAVAETDWAFIGMAPRVPRLVPPELAEAFVIVAKEDEP